MPNLTPRISVVVVHGNEAGDTRRALEGLLAVDWPADRLEVFVASPPTVDLPLPPGARSVRVAADASWAAAANAAAGVASGELLAFLAADARPDRPWLAEASAALDADVNVACVASKVLDWDGERTLFDGPALGFDGRPVAAAAGVATLGEVARECLYADAGGLVLRRSVFNAVGGFDEHLGDAGADIDLGWRIWLSGRRVRYVPRSIVHRREHAGAGQPAPEARRAAERRGGLLSIGKNLGDTLQTRALAATVVADPDADGVLRAELAWMRPARAQVQAERVCSDHELLRFFRVPAGPAGEPFRAFGLDEALDGRRRVLVVSADVFSARMAGPAIRAYQIAQVLSREHEVRLVSVEQSDLEHPDFLITSAGERELRGHERWCDVLVVQGHLLREFPFLARTSKVLVADVYDPIHLEQLAMTQGEAPADQEDVVQASVEVLNEQLARADYVLCASDKQRDFWLGSLSALGRLSPRTYADDPMFERLIAVVPFGVADEPPVRTGPGLRGVVPGIGHDDKVVLWGGGIYNWFDPVTLIRAIGLVKDKVPGVRLVFMGTKHPNPRVGEMRAAEEAARASDELGLTGTHVFFNASWVPYSERQNMLLDADVGVSTHHLHAETAFSFRTRLLDYFWAGLPVVTTEGDGLADLVAARGVGFAVPPEDVESLATVLTTLLGDPALAAGCHDRSLELADELRWERVLAPLVAFCRDPRRAPDAGPAERRRRSLVPRRVRGRLGADLRTIEALQRQGGWRSVARAATGRLRRLLGR